MSKPTARLDRLSRSDSKRPADLSGPEGSSRASAQGKPTSRSERPGGPARRKPTSRPDGRGSGLSGPAPSGLAGTGQMWGYLDLDESFPNLSGTKNHYHDDWKALVEGFAEKINMEASNNGLNSTIEEQEFGDFTSEYVVKITSEVSAEEAQALFDATKQWCKDNAESFVSQNLGPDNSDAQGVRTIADSAKIKEGGAPSVDTIYMTTFRTRVTNAPIVQFTSVTGLGDDGGNGGGDNGGGNGGGPDTGPYPIVGATSEKFIIEASGPPADLQGGGEVEVTVFDIDIDPPDDPPGDDPPPDEDPPGDEPIDDPVDGPGGGRVGIKGMARAARRGRAQKPTARLDRIKTGGKRAASRRPTRQGLGQGIPGATTTYTVTSVSTTPSGNVNVQVEGTVPSSDINVIENMGGGAILTVTSDTPPDDGGGDDGGGDDGGGNGGGGNGGGDDGGGDDGGGNGGGGNGGGDDGGGNGGGSDPGGDTDISFGGGEQIISGVSNSTLYIGGAGLLGTLLLTSLVGEDSPPPAPRRLPPPRR